MIREPAVAGQFYAADAGTLRAQVHSFLAPLETRLDATAVVVPHAGYVYSGPVAGAVYGAIQVPSRVIILGPNHTGRGVPLSLYPSGFWRTPLGLAPIDDELNGLLLQECSTLREDTRSHAREHALEVQIPFLQILAPEFRFSAICVGATDYSSLQELGHALARVLRTLDEPVLLISSSDMSHYERADVAEQKDRMAIEPVLGVDPAALYQVVHEEEISMCGFAPTVAVLTACRDLGACTGRLVRYANSGDVSGDYDRVVGYAGMVVR